MSETPGIYAGEEQVSERYLVRDEGPHDYYSQIPNLVDEMHLSPFAYRLYGHLRRVAGESGKCWQSTTTLAKACDMSAGKISDAKQELENTYPPLIRIISKSVDGKTYHEVSVTDIWSLNHDHFTGNTVHHMNGHRVRSPHERDRSPHERKKNPIKKNPVAPQKKDIIDGIVELSQSSGMTKVLAREHIASRIKVRLSMNPSGKDAESFIEYAASMKIKNGWDIEQFLDWWLIEDNGGKRAFWSFRRMEQQYDAPFMNAKAPEQTVMFVPESEMPKQEPAPEPVKFAPHPRLNAKNRATFERLEAQS